MRRLLIALAAPLLLLLAVHPARGQTPPPSPSATPSPTPISTPMPGAMASLQRMRQAMMAAATLSFHFRSSTVAEGKRQVDMTVDGVASFQANSFHQATTIVHTQLNKTPHVAIMDRNELEAAGQQAAWRVPNMSWQCESIPDTGLNTALVALELKPVSARVLGAGTVGGIPTTRMTSKATIYPWTGNQMDAVEVDIAQASGLPLRITSTFATRLNGLNARQTLTETYAKYGDPVHVTLPKKCR